MRRIGKLSIRVLTYEAASIHGQALVTLPGVRGAVKSRVARARSRAGWAMTLHLRFAPAKLRKIKARLAEHRLRARIVVTVRGAGGWSVTLSRSVRIKP